MLCWVLDTWWDGAKDGSNVKRSQLSSEARTWVVECSSADFHVFKPANKYYCTQHLCISFAWPVFHWRARTIQVSHSQKYTCIVFASSSTIFFKECATNTHVYWMEISCTIKYYLCSIQHKEVCRIASARTACWLTFIFQTWKYSHWTHQHKTLFVATHITIMPSYVHVHLYVTTVWWWYMKQCAVIVSNHSMLSHDVTYILELYFMSLFGGCDLQTCIYSGVEKSIIEIKCHSYTCTMNTVHSCFVGW